MLRCNLNYIQYTVEHIFIIPLYIYIYIDHRLHIIIVIYIYIQREIYIYIYTQGCPVSCVSIRVMQICGVIVPCQSVPGVNPCQSVPCQSVSCRPFNPCRASSCRLLLHPSSFRLVQPSIRYMNDYTITITITITMTITINDYIECNVI